MESTKVWRLAGLFLFAVYFSGGGGPLFSNRYEMGHQMLSLPAKVSIFINIEEEKKSAR